MKLIKILIISFFLIGINTSANAQFWKKLKEKAAKKIEQEAENRAERRMNKKIDKQFDKAEEVLDGKDKAKNKDNKKSNPLKNMGGIMGEIMNPKDIKTKKTYVFDITATMEVTELKNGKVTSMKQSYGKDASLTIVDETPQLIITDFENEASIILDDKKKTAQLMSLSWMKKMMQMEGQEDSDNNAASIKVTKTGNTKTINGYTCYEYNIEHEDAFIIAWFAPNVPFSYKDYLQGFTKMMGKEIGNLPQDIGYAMQMTVSDKGKQVTSMKTTTLSEEKITINLLDYKIQKMF